MNERKKKAYASAPKRNANTFFYAYTERYIYITVFFFVCVCWGG